MKEIWKDIRNYEGYFQVSNFGRIRSLDRFVLQKSKKGKYGKRIVKGKMKKTPVDMYGYFKVSLWKNAKSETREVHRYVAETFIPNPLKLEQVNHIDGNKFNNRVDNLEWVTPIENTRHSMYVLGNNHYKKICQYDLKGNYITTYESIKEASRITGANRHSISNVLHGRRNKAGGFKWGFMN